MTTRGLQDLQRRLNGMPAIAKARIRQAMEKGAEEIVAMMKRLVAVDDGDLRDSIGWTWGRAPRGSISVGSVNMLGGELTITIYAGNATAYYARFVEFGTASHTAGGEFAGATIPAISASPYFYVSFRANRKRVKSRIVRAINKAAREAAAGS